MWVKIGVVMNKNIFKKKMSFACKRYDEVDFDKHAYRL